MCNDTIDDGWCLCIYFAEYRIYEKNSSTERFGTRDRHWGGYGKVSE